VRDGRLGALREDDRDPVATLDAESAEGIAEASSPKVWRVTWPRWSSQSSASASAGWRSQTSRPML
jgi:hypothetical protein